MKTAALFLATITGVAAFSTPGVSQSRASTSLSAEPVLLANGAMSFNRVCREWRCKYDGDKVTSASLEAIAKIVDEKLPEIKKVSSDITVNRLVCGGCLDFKLMMTVPLEDFGPWEEAEFAPEKDFLEAIKAIEGVSLVETQTITNMEI
eukprot:CAMPEP_0198137192 /NCGR_PEP_ID=MMETSP1443-20131203/726_1 /TAXON_ID=186043 /ORGANISM="Entomoneis sp., Strain CCMP2396" /LENGTH=148 /DNA_ID=CAMNT_0043798545 /DNA_START=176 /DNA_END=622 /DNA_ORIENTATION=-